MLPSLESEEGPFGRRHISCAPSVAGKMARLWHTVSRALTGEICGVRRIKTTNNDEQGR